MKSCNDWHRLDTGTSVHLERKNLSFYWTSQKSFSSNSCWHNYIKNTSLNLTFNIFIRLTHYLYFAALEVVVTLQSKSVKDYSLQFSVRITALFAELKHLYKVREIFFKSDAILIFLKWACHFSYNKPLNRESDRTSFIHCYTLVYWCTIGFLHFQK